MKVLVADDDKVFVELVSSRFRGQGFEVQVAFDVMQAMMGAMKAPPDVILLDVKMPGGTGFDALRRLKANGKTAAIPVIVISALEEPGISDKVQGLGAAAFIPKPASFEEIYATVCRVVGKAADAAAARG